MSESDPNLFFVAAKSHTKIKLLEEVAMINYCAHSYNSVNLHLFLNTELALLFTANSHISNIMQEMI